MVDGDQMADWPKEAERFAEANKRLRIGIELLSFASILATSLSTTRNCDQGRATQTSGAAISS
jgi:hypothetical protein